MLLKTHEWMELKEKMPDYIKEFVSLCIHFYDKAEDIETMLRHSNIALAGDVNELYTTFQIIIDTYRRMMKDGIDISQYKGTIEEITDEIEKRIDTNYGEIILIRTRGSEKIMQAITSENANEKAGVILSKGEQFLYKIHSALNRAYNKQLEKQVFLSKVVTEVGRELGTPPPIVKDGGTDIEALMGEKKEKKPKKEKKKEEEDEDE